MRRMFSEKQIKGLAKTSVEDASSGTLNQVLGLDSDGGLVKGTIEGGTKIYLISFYFSKSSSYPSNQIGWSFYSLRPLNKSSLGTQTLTETIYNDIYESFKKTYLIKKVDNISASGTGLTLTDGYFSGWSANAYATTKTVLIANDGTISVTVNTKEVSSEYYAFNVTCQEI